jgi:multidrug efflux pump subunit AcrA (membrane-fusion protein)
LPTLRRLLDAPESAIVQAFISDEKSAQNMLGEGRLTLIDNQIAANTATLRAKAEFANDDQNLWPGQLVNVKVQTALYRDALVVPPKVVLRGLNNHFVYRLNGDVAEVLPVKVVYRDSETVIIEGAQAGDVLISDGQSRLKPGTKVEVLGEPSEQALAIQAQQ